jgi:hypothetical protein
MEAASDPAASGGAYIRSTTSNSGTASYAFSIAEAGAYRIIARVHAQDDGSDSFFFSIDGQPEDVWDLNPGNVTGDFGVWREDAVSRRGSGTFDRPESDPYTVQLSPGAHTIAFRGREKNARLDYFYPAGTHRSDSNTDGCVSMPELTAFLDLWKSNSSNPTIRELMEAIGMWKAGCP